MFKALAERAKLAALASLGSGAARGQLSVRIIADQLIGDYQRFCRRSALDQSDCSLMFWVNNSFEGYAPVAFEVLRPAGFIDADNPRILGHDESERVLTVVARAMFANGDATTERRF